MPTLLFENEEKRMNVLGLRNMGTVDMGMYPRISGL